MERFMNRIPSPRFSLPDHQRVREAVQPCIRIHAWVGHWRVSVVFSGVTGSLQSSEGFHGLVSLSVGCVFVLRGQGKSPSPLIISGWSISCHLGVKFTPCHLIVWVSGHSLSSRYYVTIHTCQLITWSQI